MGRLLLNLPTEASTSKYPAMFPYPLLLLKLKRSGDILHDLGLQCYKQTKEVKTRIVTEYVHKVVNTSRRKEIVVCCGDYAPDAHYSEWFELFLREVRVPVKVCGSYAEISPERVKVISRFASVLHVDLDVSDVVIPDAMLEEHPLVNGHPKADVKMTVGCPRLCTMCPVPTIYNGRFRYTDTDRTLELIQHYHSRGVRFINFVDDNLSAGVRKFTKFMGELRALKLRGMKFHCQEGFEVLPFKNDEFCAELAQSDFVDVKVGFENIKEDFLESIDKYYTKFSDIELAISNLEKYNIDARMFLLLSPMQSEADIMDNLRFIAKHKLNVRANVLRMYDGMKYAREGAVLVPVKRLTELRALAYGASFMSRVLGIDIFDPSAFSRLRDLGYDLVENGIGGCRIVGGRQNFGIQTSKWISGMRYILCEHLRAPVSIAYDKNGSVVKYVQQTWF